MFPTYIYNEKMVLYAESGKPVGNPETEARQDRKDENENGLTDKNDNENELTS